jgi:hypothetical protein
MADVVRTGLTHTPQGLVPASEARRNITGMGFRFETGVITVTAQADRVRVTADRLVLYSGTHVHNPPGSEFDIGTPAVTADGMSLDVPITVTPLQPLTLVLEPLAATVQDRTEVAAAVLDRTGLSVTVQDRTALAVTVEDA